MSINKHSQLIKALLHAECYTHPAAKISMVETHISWIILAGSYAYKIKKPLDLGFLDFSNLKKRHFFCEEELRLNRRLAPQLYLDITPITGTPAHPVMNGDGEPFEYALRMRQFDQANQFDRLLEQQGLMATHIDQIASILAYFHQSITVAPPETPYGQPELAWQPVKENYTQIKSLISSQTTISQLDHLQAWFEQQKERLNKLFAKRKQGGFVRECHGDLHLANIALYKNEIVIFDCLEFNKRLRWIDVISDAAFLMMDLDSRKQQALGLRFMNAYLHHSGDYEALPLLHYYLAYRAMVRAKVACIRISQHGLSAIEQQHEENEFQNYLTLAVYYSQSTSPALIITHGLSGSGKTTITQSIIEELGAIRIRSDVERKRLHGLSENVRSKSELNEDLYDRGASDATYTRLADLASTIIKAGYTAIIDATFLQQARRNTFHQLADKLRVPFTILDFYAPETQLRQWIIERDSSGGDASEANIAVLENQIANQDILTTEEREWAISVNTTHDIDISALAKSLAERS